MNAKISRLQIRTESDGWTLGVRSENQTNILYCLSSLLFLDRTALVQ